MHSIITFLKNWTLPSAIFTGTVLYLTFYRVPALDTMGDWLAPLFDAIMPLFMGMILYTTFIRVEFHKMRVARWHVWITFFQLLFVAILTALILGFKMRGNNLVLMEGILTCVICPGAAAAAVVTAKLGGDLETMTSYTFLSNFVTALLVPVVFPLIDPKVDMPFVQSFLRILYKVCLVLLVPMAAAYVTKRWLPRLQQRLIAIPDLSFYMWGISLTIVTGCTVKSIVHAAAPAAFLSAIALVSLLLCITQFAVGRYIGHFFGTQTEAGQALGQKNTAFAVWIAYAYLSPLSVAGPGCYILWQNGINSIEIWHSDKLRRHAATEEKK